MPQLERTLGPIWLFIRGFAVSVVGNVSLAVLALALALSLWLFVTDHENPKTVEAFNSAIPIRFVNTPNARGVANVSDTNVRIRVEAPQNEFKRLSADDFDATVNLGGLDTGKVTVAVNVTPPNDKVNVTDITPAHIEVTLESLRSKEVSVRVSLVGSPQQGFVATSPRSDPQTVTLTGPESLVPLVDAAVAEVNLTGVRTNVADDRVQLKPRDRSGGDVSRVTVQPQTARVSVDVQQTEFTQAFIVSPKIIGGPGAGYNVTSIVTDPQFVFLTGNLTTLQSIDPVRGIGTEEITIADARSDVARTAQLAVPDGVRAQGPSSVNIRVGIAPAKGEFSFRIVPQVRNLAGSLAAAPIEPVTVTLAGDVPTLDSLSPEAIIVSADAQGLEAGFHNVPLNVQPPAGTSVARIDPPQVGIAFVRRP